MPRGFCACFVVGLFVLLGAAPALAADGFVAAKRISKGDSFSPVTFRDRHVRHRPHRHSRYGWRPSVPLYLDRRGYGGSAVVIQQTIAPVTVVSSYPAVPSFKDLPVSMGIRETSPAEPAIYVLNEGAPPRYESSRSGRGSGPRIITLPDVDDEPVMRETALGARIIHLTVPVGSRS